MPKAERIVVKVRTSELKRLLGMSEYEWRKLRRERVAMDADWFAERIRLMERERIAASVLSSG